MTRRISLLLAGSALALVAASAVGADSTRFNELAMARDAGANAGKAPHGVQDVVPSPGRVHDKQVTAGHGAATLNAYLDAHCLAIPDAVALGGGLAGACGGLRSTAPATVKN